MDTLALIRVKTMHIKKDTFLIAGLLLVSKSFGDEKRVKIVSDVGGRVTYAGNAHDSMHQIWMFATEPFACTTSTKVLNIRAEGQRKLKDLFFEVDWSKSTSSVKWSSEDLFFQA